MRTIPQVYNPVIYHRNKSINTTTSYYTTWKIFIAIFYTEYKTAKKNELKEKYYDKYTAETRGDDKIIDIIIIICFEEIGIIGSVGGNNMVPIKEIRMTDNDKNKKDNQN